MIRMTEKLSFYMSYQPGTGWTFDSIDNGRKIADKHIKRLEEYGPSVVWTGAKYRVYVKTKWFGLMKTYLIFYIHEI